MTRRTFLWSWLLFCLVNGLGIGAARAAERVRVDSSVLTALTYDAAARTLDVEFRSGVIYRYLAVPQATYDELMRASSKGRYFNQRIRDRFRTEQLQRELGDGSAS